MVEKSVHHPYLFLELRESSIGMTDAEFKAIFREHQAVVYRFAWRITDSAQRAEDITQETFLALLKAPARFDPARGTMRGFLLGIARHLALKLWREELRWEELDSDEVWVPAFDFSQGETGDRVAAAVRALPPLQREALVLATYEGMPLAEIARVVHADVGTVKSRLWRARENLRRVLAPVSHQQRHSQGVK